jgi:cytoskeletal protein CcmA (bactofilin family)
MMMYIDHAAKRREGGPMRGIMMSVRALCLCGLALLVAVGARAQENTGAHFATRSGLHFYSGGDIHISTPASTVFAAGGNIAVDTNDIEEIFAAAGDISLRDIVANRIIAAGGKIHIGGTVTRNVIVAGGEVDVRKGSRIGGDVIVATGRLIFDADVGGDFLAAARTITLGGHFSGDVKLRGQDITLRPGTRIDGNLIYRGRDALVIPDGVQIGGTVLRGEGSDVVTSDAASGFFGIVAAIFAVFLGAVVALLVLACIALALLGRSIANAASVVTSRALPSIGIGVLLAVAVPVVGGILVITIIGIPLALLVFAAYAVLFGLGVVVAAYWIGMKLRTFTTPRAAQPDYVPALGWTLLGLLIFVFLGAIPFIGTLLQFVATVAGMGALILAMTAVDKASDKSGSPAATLNG